jgi:hypothetical protein
MLDSEKGTPSHVASICRSWDVKPADIVDNGLVDWTTTSPTSNQVYLCATGSCARGPCLSFFTLRPVTRKGICPVESDICRSKTVWLWRW